MNAALTGPKGRWTIAVVGAVGVLVALMMLTRLPTPASFPSPTSLSASKPAVQLANPLATGDAVLKEEMELRDPRPLFLPTRFNATLPEPRLETGRTFLDNEAPKVGLADSNPEIALSLPPIVTLNGKPLARATAEAKGGAAAQPTDVLVDEGPGAAIGFGRGQTEIRPLGARGGYVEVISIATGVRVLSEALPIEAVAPGNKPWDPLELRVMVDAAGLIAPLVVTTSSRVEEVDAHYRNYLTRKYRIGERLPPGFYRVSVAP